MTVLIGGMRPERQLGVPRIGVFTDRPGTLTTDFFVNLARHGARSGSRRDGPRTSTRVATARRATSSGPPPPSTSSSGRTRSSGPSRRSTRPTTRRRSSCATSWRRGTRS
jgi:hypothetical protein